MAKISIASYKYQQLDQLECAYLDVGLQKAFSSDFTGLLTSKQRLGFCENVGREYLFPTIFLAKAAHNYCGCAIAGKQLSLLSVFNGMTSFEESASLLLKLAARPRLVARALYHAANRAQNRFELGSEDIYLSYICVDSEFSSLGVGRRLLQAMEEQLRTVGVKRIVCHMNALDSKITGFYEGAGWWVVNKNSSRSLCLKEIG